MSVLSTFPAISGIHGGRYTDSTGLLFLCWLTQVPPPSSDKEKCYPLGGRWIPRATRYNQNLPSWVRRGNTPIYTSKKWMTKTTRNTNIFSNHHTSQTCHPVTNVFALELRGLTTEQEILFEWRSQTGNGGLFWSARQSDITGSVETVEERHKSAGDHVKQFSRKKRFFSLWLFTLCCKFARP